MIATVVLASILVMTHNCHFFFCGENRKKKKGNFIVPPMEMPPFISFTMTLGNKSILAVLQMTFTFAKYCLSSRRVRLSKSTFKANGSNDRSFKLKI